MDNNLPVWWLRGFYYTIVFGALYLLYYHFGGGPNPEQEYLYEMADGGYTVPLEVLEERVDDVQWPLLLLLNFLVTAFVLIIREVIRIDKNSARDD